MYEDRVVGSVNDTTNTLTKKIIFGVENNPEDYCVYTDLSTGKQYGPHESFSMPIITIDEYQTKVEVIPSPIEQPSWNCFPGYFLVRDEKGSLHNMYRGVDVGFGGYVYANPGMYGRAVTLDVRSMHPWSIIGLNLFGTKFTARFKDLVDLRALIKHKEYDKASMMFGGVLAKYLKDDASAKKLSKALKTAINSVYGLTAASFQNACKDIRNINNIVALRGALFMKSLQDEVEAKGFKVIHIKTDSIKIADPTDDILNFCMEYGKKMGYEFEIEHTWKKLCLVNKGVFVGMHDDDDEDSPGEWETTGAQFQIPYVRKTLFTHEPIDFYDMAETKTVQNAMYLDISKNPEKPEYRFIGRVGLFCPMQEGYGYTLLSKNNKDKLVSVTGTKGYLWEEASIVKGLHLEEKIDKSYYTKLVDEAVATIGQYGDFNSFAAD